MPRGQGRPSHSVVINFNHPLDSMGKIEALLKSEPIRENIVKFAKIALVGFFSSLQDYSSCLHDNVLTLIGCFNGMILNFGEKTIAKRVCKIKPNNVSVH